MPVSTVAVTAESLHRFYVACFAAMGVPAAQARSCADGLHHADLHGIPTHGAAALDRLYLTMLRDGLVEPTAVPVVERDHRAVAVVDGRNAIGFVTAEFAMGEAIERAGRFGVGAVAVRNSSHCGSMGWYTGLAARRGVIGLASTNLGGQRIVPPPGGAEPMLGTNVLAASAPAGELPPFNLDMSTAVVAAGRVRQARRRGERVPEGWLVDARGETVTDPAAFDEGTARLRFLGGDPDTGGHKGYGLAVLADVLCGVLGGAAFGPGERAPEGPAREDADIGHFFLALDVPAFRAAGEFASDMDRLLGGLAGTAPVDPARPVGYPGLPEQRFREANAGTVPLDRDVAEDLERVARRLGVAPPERADGPLRLRYGLNPHQEEASASPVRRTLPFVVRGGRPSYLALMDALAGWRLVRDGRAVLGRPVAASIKHTGPNGVGMDVPLSEAEAAALRAPDDLSPIALAYVRARGTDRVAAYGDMIALSEPADESFARAVRGEAVNGVIAPGYDAAALEILRAKRDGGLLILQVDEQYQVPQWEHREIFGVSLRQRRDTVLVTRELLAGANAGPNGLAEQVLDDLALATLTAQHAESNAVCVAHRGQTVGIGAGQPSRIRATRIACAQTRSWFLRQHPAVLDLRFDGRRSRHDLDTAVDEFLSWSTLHTQAREELRASARSWSPPLDERQRDEWLHAVDGLALGSDGAFPFADSLYTAATVGVRYVAHAGGARRDATVAAVADELKMTLIPFGIRLFRH